LTWADILSEEPFEGEHWEGIYHPGRSTSINEPDYESRGESEPSLSPLNSDDLTLDDESDSLSSNFDELVRPVRTPTVESGENDGHTPSKQPYPFDSRKQFEELQSKQYWRDDWHTDAPLYSPFDLGDPSTLGVSEFPCASWYMLIYLLGPTLSRVLAQASGFQDALAMLKPEVLLFSLS
jgi:gamma-tubulin complex component 5